MKNAILIGLRIAVGLIVGLIAFGLMASAANYVMERWRGEPASLTTQAGQWTKWEKDQFYQGCMGETDGSQYAIDYCNCATNQIANQYTADQVDYWGLTMTESEMQSLLRDTMDYCNEFARALRST